LGFAHIEFAGYRLDLQSTFRMYEMTKKRASMAMVIFTLVLAGPVLAGDWPHWRGPFLNGASDEKNLPATWSTTQNVAWCAPLPGHSSATPVIANGKVFVSSTERDSDNLLALCFDAQSGKELWRRRLARSSRQVPRNNMATSSPVADDKRVYFMYGSGELAGLDHEGRPLWSRNIDSEYGNISMKYGYSSSPLLYGDRLYILSRIDMEDRPVQASIAIADGRLFIRTANLLYCISN